MELRDQLKSLSITIAPEAEERLQLFLDEVLRWSRTINLTAITDRHAAEEKHLVDSLTLLPLLRGDERLLDMGSGAGMPGLPLRIVLPRLQLLSVDAAAKKITFQRHVIRLLALEGVEARHGRLEDLGREANFSAAFEVVVARAFSDLATCARMAAPFLRSGGRLVAMKGPEGEAELVAHTAAIRQSGYVKKGVTRLRLPVSGAVRLLIELEKVAAEDLHRAGEDFA